MARRTSPNTRLGGHAARIGWRQVVVDPNGNREQRRAARKLGVAETPASDEADAILRGLRDGAPDV